MSWNSVWCHSNPSKYIFHFINQLTVWTSNVVPAEIVRKPPRRPSAGGLRIFWLKSLANPEKIFKKNFFLHFFDNFVWICQWFSQKIRRPPAEGLRGVSGQFPPGQQCWSTRYMDSKFNVDKKNLYSPKKHWKETSSKLLGFEFKRKTNL